MKQGQNSKKKSLCYLVTEDWYFYSHRLPMARAAQNAGFDVSVIANIQDHQDRIEAEGIKVISFAFDRRSLDPWDAIDDIRALTEIYKTHRPDIVHHIAMKPVLFGSIAARLAKIPVVLNAFAGLGYLFTENDFRARFLRAIVIPVFRIALAGKRYHALFQNPDDRETLRHCKLIHDDRTHLIRGSGVSLSDYPDTPLPPLKPAFICAFAGRMISIKGLQTLKEAFEILKETAPHIQLRLCGAPDPGNPASWTEAQLQNWMNDNPNVQWLGKVSNMAQIWQESHLAIQASYGGEGIPKSLLEAAACGRPIVATDVPGCREIVKQGQNGYLVPPKEAKPLASAIQKIADDIIQAQQMGNASRALVARDLSDIAVSEQTKKLYQDLAAIER